jgi:hypothetical protein
MCDAAAESPEPWLPIWSILRISKPWDEAINGWLGKVANDPVRKATTGMHMFFVAAALCDDLRVYGFVDTKGVRGYHYYDNEPKQLRWCARSGRARRGARACSLCVSLLQSPLHPDSRSLLPHTACASPPLSPPVPFPLALPPTHTHPPRARSGTNCHSEHNFALEHRLFDTFAWRGLQFNLCNDPT